MARLLGEEYASFAQSYGMKARVGLRVNTLKIPVADFIKKSPFTLSPVGAYEPAGFIVHGRSQPGRHATHAAGLYYLQEPAAMTVAALLDPQPGELVLDLAAAPGGKATHLAARMKDKGLLVANDMHQGRARILAQNMERWGARNVLITSNTPQHLAAAFGPVFDRVLVDAPCSGEGMFRRQGSFDWSENIVAACARRQTHILDSAADLVRPGGRLAYSTCTFSPEENEGVIGRFLDDHPDFELVALPEYEGFAQGRPSWGNGRPKLARTVRLWPHRFAGEGHFIALLRRVAGKEKPVRMGKPDRLAAAHLNLWREFAAGVLQVELDEQKMVVVNGRYLTLLPEIQLDTTGLYVLRHGLNLGELRFGARRRGFFKPAHTLALSLTAAEVTAPLDLPPESTELAAYLSGQPLKVTDDGSRMTGNWTLVTVLGFGLGWGKRVGSRLQNHYPRGLRT